MTSWKSKVKPMLAHYPHSSRILKELDQVLPVYVGLQPRQEQTVDQQQRTEHVLALRGTIPIAYRGETYHIPVCILLPRQYPKIPPLVYVVPTDQMVLRTSESVDPQGRWLSTLLSSAWKENTSLTEIIVAMQRQFAQQPPVYSKPPAPVAASAAASLSRPPATAASVSYPQLSARPPASTSNQQECPPPYSFTDPSANDTMIPGNNMTTPGYYAQQPVGYPPAGYAGYSGGYPYSQPSSMPSIPVQATTSSSSPASSSSSTFYPPILPLGVVGSTTANSSGKSTPTMSSPAVSSAVINHSSAIPSSSSPASLAQSRPGGTGSPIPSSLSKPLATPESLKIASIRMALTEKFRERLKKEHDLLSARIDEALLVNKQLLDQERLVATGFMSLSAAQTRMTAGLDSMRRAQADLKQILDTQKQTTLPPITELLQAPKPLYKQLFELVAEDHAIDDAIFYLGQAVNHSEGGGLDVTLPVFMRLVRSLAREQFMKRALVRKIRQQLGLPT